MSQGRVDSGAGLDLTRMTEARQQSYAKVIGDEVRRREELSETVRQEQRQRQRELEEQESIATQVGRAGVDRELGLSDTHAHGGGPHPSNSPRRSPTVNIEGSLEEGRKIRKGEVTFLSCKKERRRETEEAGREGRPTPTGPLLVDTQNMAERVAGYKSLPKPGSPRPRPLEAPGVGGSSDWTFSTLNPPHEPIPPTLLPSSKSFGKRPVGSMGPPISRPSFHRVPGAGGSSTSVVMLPMSTMTPLKVSNMITVHSTQLGLEVEASNPPQQTLHPDPKHNPNEPTSKTSNQADCGKSDPNQVSDLLPPPEFGLPFSVPEVAQMIQDNDRTWQQNMSIAGDSQGNATATQTPQERNEGEDASQENKSVVEIYKRYLEKLPRSPVSRRMKQPMATGRVERRDSCYTQAAPRNTSYYAKRLPSQPPSSSNPQPTRPPKKTKTYPRVEAWQQNPAAY